MILLIFPSVSYLVAWSRYGATSTQSKFGKFFDHFTAWLFITIALVVIVFYFYSLFKKDDAWEW